MSDKSWWLPIYMGNDMTRLYEVSACYDYFRYLYKNSELKVCGFSANSVIVEEFSKHKYHIHFRGQKGVESLSAGMRSPFGYVDFEHLVCLEMTELFMSYELAVNVYHALLSFDEYVPLEFWHQANRHCNETFKVITKAVSLMGVTKIAKFIERATMSPAMLFAASGCGLSFDEKEKTAVFANSVSCDKFARHYPDWVVGLSKPDPDTCFSKQMVDVMKSFHK